MKRRELLGLLLWRGGLLLAGGWAAFRAARFALRFLELPAAVEVGVSLGVAGAMLVMASLVLENREDRRAEGTRPMNAPDPAQHDTQSPAPSARVRTTRFGGFVLFAAGVVVLLWYFVSKAWAPLREVLPWFHRLDLPIRIGLGAAAVGGFLLLCSVVWERWQDHQAEKKLPEGRY